MFGFFPSARKTARKYFSLVAQHGPINERHLYSDDGSEKCTAEWITTIGTALAIATVLAYDKLTKDMNHCPSPVNTAFQVSALLNVGMFIMLHIVGLRDHYIDKKNKMQSVNDLNGIHTTYAEIQEQKTQGNELAKLHTKVLILFLKLMVYASEIRKHKLSRKEQKLVETALKINNSRRMEQHPELESCANAIFKHFKAAEKFHAKQTKEATTEQNAHTTLSM